MAKLIFIVLIVVCLCQMVHFSVGLNKDEGSKAYKALFVHSKVLSDKEALKNMEILINYGLRHIEDPFYTVDIEELQLFHEIEPSKCTHGYIGKLKSRLEQSKELYKGLSGYLKHCYDKQLTLCKEEEGYQEEQPVTERWRIDDVMAENEMYQKYFGDFHF